MKRTFEGYRIGKEKAWTWKGFGGQEESGKIRSVFSHPHALSSVQFSRSVVSNSLQPHELQHARPPCPSPTPGVHSDSCPSSQWCHPAISSSVVPFCSCPQSLPASESFPMSQLFEWGGQSTGVSALASFLPKKSQCWSPSEWTELNWTDGVSRSQTPLSDWTELSLSLQQPHMNQET